MFILPQILGMPRVLRSARLCCVTHTALQYYEVFYHLGHKAWQSAERQHVVIFHRINYS
jgi:hypothetical protein